MIPNRIQAAVAEFFNREADQFPLVGSGNRGILSQLADGVFRRSIRLRFDRVMELCQPTEDRSVLDIGCGTGAYAIRLAQRGASQVRGIDLASRMVELARMASEAAGVAGKCTFEVGSLEDLTSDRQFDYSIAVGVLDYVSDAQLFIHKTFALTRVRACFSLPRYEGLLAWQRRLRYRNRCPLFMYRRADVHRLFEGIAAGYKLERLARDWFVTVECGNDSTA